MGVRRVRLGGMCRVHLQGSCALGTVWKAKVGGKPSHEARGNSERRRERTKLVVRGRRGAGKTRVSRAERLWVWLLEFVR